PKAWGLGLTWAGQAGLDLVRYRFRLDAGPLGMKLGPDALLETLNRQLVALEDAVADGAARSAPFGDLAFGRDHVVIEARPEESRSGIDQRHADGAVFLPQLGSGKPGALEQPRRADV